MGTYVRMYRSVTANPNPSDTGGVELAALPVEHLEHELCELAAHVEAGMARWVALVGEDDRREGWGSWGGGCSCAGGVAWRRSCSPRAARGARRGSPAPPRPPQIRDALSFAEL